MEIKGSARVKRRRVFYIPGYDPLPARRYRELFRTEAIKQAEISDYTLAFKADKTPVSWRARSDINGYQAEAQLKVLVWNDIVQASMSKSLFATYVQLLRTSWIYLTTGTFRRLSWLAKGPVLAALYPVLMLLCQLAIAIALAVVGGIWISNGVAALLAFVNVTSDMWWFDLVMTFVSVGFGVPILVALLRWFRALDDRLFAHYLMHDYAFTASAQGAYPAALEARLLAFRSEVIAALNSDVDEVLIVGHSSGAQLAVSLAADLIRHHKTLLSGPVLSLLTLGQVIPMVSFLPKADRLRGDLNLLAQTDDVAWVDVSAPGDGCCFALSDPVAVSGVAPAVQRWPLIISAAFTNTLSEARRRELRHRYFRLHFQYLCAFDQPGDYDFFQITVGPMTLRERYRRRRSSAQRIDVSASRFSSMVA